MYLDAFPLSSSCAIVLPKPPLQSVVHIKYTDQDGVLQTWADTNYTVDTDSEEGMVYPVYNGSWPSDVRDVERAVNIQYVAGYADSGASPRDLADSVPQGIKHAIMMLVGHMYENRESTSQQMTITDVPMGFDALLASYRIYRF